MVAVPTSRVYGVSFGTQLAIVLRFLYLLTAVLEAVVELIAVKAAVTTWAAFTNIVSYCLEQRYLTVSPSAGRIVFSADPLAVAHSLCPDLPRHPDDVPVPRHPV